MSTVCRWPLLKEHDKTSEESLDNKKRPWSWPWTRKNKNLQVPLTEAQLRGWFKRFDTNNDGRLSKEELKSALEGLGSTFPAWRTWRALRHADENGDGYISEDELDGLVKYIVKRGYSPSSSHGELKTVYT